jgi:hypothetical protein
MPVKPRKTVHRRQQTELHESELHYMFYGRFPEATSCKIPFLIFGRGYGASEKWRRFWLEHKDEVMSEWKKEHRTGKPWAARVFDD